MRFSELDGRTVGVWGLGREILSFARHLAERLPGARVAAVAFDDPAAAPAELPAGLAGARVVGPGAEAVEALGACDVVVRSPGVSIHREELRTLAAQGVPHTTPTGLWLAEHGPRRVIGITGTKGKSTTATAAAHLLRAAGEPVELAGNIGRPALDLLDATDPDTWVVLELSSYQIADLPAGPQVAVMTNLYNEHVDWHGDAETYRREKLRLLSLPEVGVCVLRPADAEAVAAASRTALRVVFETPEGWHVDGDGGIVDGAGGAGAQLAADALPLRGRHNAANLCATLAALDAAGVPRPADLAGALRGLEPLPHRLQTVHTAGGVEWVDDSISTTPESTLAALDAYPGRDVVLIAGGSDREQDFTALAAELARRPGVTLLAVPLTGARLADAARAAGLDADRVATPPDLPAAVAEAHARATAGTVVLLSPAAPSYHAYRDFTERGAHFLALATAATE